MHPVVTVIIAVLALGVFLVVAGYLKAPPDTAYTFEPSAYSMIISLFSPRYAFSPSSACSFTKSMIAVSYVSSATILSSTMPHRNTHTITMQYMSAALSILFIETLKIGFIFIFLSPY